MPDSPTVLPLASPGTPTPDRKSIYTLMLINFVDLLGFGLVLLLLPFYATRFEGVLTWHVALMQAIYPFCAFISSPILGAWSDRIGRRPVLIVSQWGSVVGYVILAFSTLVDDSQTMLGLGLLFLSRVIDGISAGNVTITNAYVADVVPPKDRAATNGLLGAAFGLGFTLGPPIGGVLGHFHPAYPGIIAAMLCAVASLMVWRYLPESHTDRTSTGAGAFFLSPSRLQALRAQPMVGYLALIWFLTMLAYTTLETAVPLILQKRMGYGMLEAGLFMGAIGMIIVFVQGGLIRPMKKLIGEWPMAMLGAILGIVGMLIYVRVAIAPTLWVIGCAAVANACGRSFKTPTLSSILSQNSDPKQQGAAYGVYQGMGSLGRVLGPGIVALMYDFHAALMFGVAASLIGLAALLLVFIKPRLKSSQADDRLDEGTLAAGATE
jgi:MFS transporter, DHA1 family, tetracycline resistance protein